MRGIKVMEDRVAASTVRAALPVIPLEAAVMVAVPGARAVARPLLFMRATAVLDELQVIACEAIVGLVPSEYRPVAVNCWEFPLERVGLAGVKDKENKAAAVTVRVVLPVIPLKAAVTVADPAAMVPAAPLEFRVATAVLEELQVTDAVIS